MDSKEQPATSQHTGLAQVTILAHGGAQAAFNRHLPLWEAHGLPILVVCPEDDLVKTKYPLLATGKSAHHGDHAYARLIEVIETLFWTRFKYHLIFEFDSFCIEPERVEWRKGLYGNLKSNTEDFMGWIYPNLPWMIDAGSLRKIRNTAREYPITEFGYYDRLMAALAICSGVPILHHIPKGYSCATIFEEHRDDLRERIRAGGHMIHGVKTKKTFDMVMELKDGL